MARQRLTSEHAFKAMLSFLEEYYDRTEFDDVRSLLGSMSLSADGNPMDAGIWRERLTCVDDALRMRINAALQHWLG